MPNFDKPTGFTMKMGSKEIYDESSPFSMRDTELMEASPMLKPLKGNQNNLNEGLREAILDSPINRNGDKEKIKTVKLDNVNLTANSPKTIAKNVKENRERTTRNTRFVDSPQEQKEVDQGKFSRSKKEVSDQDYRIFQRRNS